LRLNQVGQTSNSHPCLSSPIINNLSWFAPETTRYNRPGHICGEKPQYALVRYLNLFSSTLAVNSRHPE